jgi:hypothetical protein
VPPLDRLASCVQVMRRVASGRGGATHGLVSSSGVYRHGTSAQVSGQVREKLNSVASSSDG